MGHDGVVTIRLVTWNLQGRARPDLGAVADAIHELAPDVVLLQEVQRRQAHLLAGMLGWSRLWRFKHWSIVVPAEGLAIMAPHPLVDAERRTLAFPWSFWSWRRRIAVAASLEGAEPVRIVNTHLGAGVGDAERARQAAHTVAMASEGAAVVGGDLNTRPGSVVLRVYEDAEFVDAWAAVEPSSPGHTNWRPGPRTAPPVQRLDYVFVGSALSPVSVSIPSDVEAVERFGAISDHVPLSVTLDVRG